MNDDELKAITQALIEVSKSGIKSAETISKILDQIEKMAEVMNSVISSQELLAKRLERLEKPQPPSGHVTVRH